MLFFSKFFAAVPSLLLAVTVAAAPTHLLQAGDIVEAHHARTQITHDSSAALEHLMARSDKLDPNGNEAAYARRGLSERNGHTIATGVDTPPNQPRGPQVNVEKRDGHRITNGADTPPNQPEGPSDPNDHSV